jgi:hypothetical protein
MATFNLSDADNYGGTGVSYFTLKDDGDSAIVRFMYNTLDDIEGYAIHKITYDNGNRYRYVSCLRDYEEPIDNCPLCANRNFQQAKFYFNLFDVKTEEVKLWERGKNVLTPLIPVLNEIKGPICGTPIKITRHGVAGDTYTKYSFEICGESDGCTVEDLPERVNPMDEIILNCTKEELETYVNTGNLKGVTDVVNSTNTNNTNTTNQTNTTSNISRRYTGRNTANNGGRGNTGGATYY